MSTHQPELCCLAELVHLAFCCVEGAHPHVSPKASLSLRASDMCFPCAGFGGSGWRSRFFLQEFDRVGSMGRVVQPHWVWRSPQEAARCWRTPPSPTRLSVGCSGNGVGLHALLQPPQTRFPVTAFSDSKMQTLGIGAFCPFCPEKTRLQSARCLCVGLEHAVLALLHGRRLGGGRESRHGGEQLLQLGAVLLPWTEGWSRDAGLTPDGGRQAACS